MLLVSIGLKSKNVHYQNKNCALKFHNSRSFSSKIGGVRNVPSIMWQRMVIKHVPPDDFRSFGATASKQNAILWGSITVWVLAAIIKCCSV